MYTWGAPKCTLRKEQGYIYCTLWSEERSGKQPLFWTRPPYVWIDFHMEIHLRFLFCKTPPLGKIPYNAMIMLIISKLQSLYYSPILTRMGKGFGYIFLPLSGTSTLYIFSPFWWQYSIKLQWIMTLKRRSKISWLLPEIMGVQHSLPHVLFVLFISSFRIYAY